MTPTTDQIVAEAKRQIDAFGITCSIDVKIALRNKGFDVSEAVISRATKGMYPR